MTSVVERAAAASKLLRPFPTRRLHDRLHQVLSYGASINDRANRLMLDPPAEVAEWTDALHEIGVMLESLADACDEAVPEIARLAQMAPGDHARALAALESLIAGVALEVAGGASGPTLRAA